MLSQGEFTADRPDKTPLRWDVPVLVSVGNKTSALQVHGGSLQTKLYGCGPVVVNSGQSGYFRTLYAPSLFASLREKYALLPPVDQFGLLADSWALGLAGDQAPSNTLALIATLGEAPIRRFGNALPAFSAICIAIRRQLGTAQTSR